MPTKLALIALYALCASATSSVACPTCVGRIAHDSPPFFSDECYEWQGTQQPHDASGDKKEQSS